MSEKQPTRISGRKRDGDGRSQNHADDGLGLRDERMDNLGILKGGPNGRPESCTCRGGGGGSLKQMLILCLKSSFVCFD